MSSSRRASAADAKDSAQELRARALRLLARREHSRAELARKLAAHAESPAAVDLLLDALSLKGQLSDERFAEARTHRLARKFGPARIRQDLKARGIAADVIAKTSFGDELERARDILGRKFKASAATREDYARRARFLQGRGFSHDTIRRALSSLADE